MAGRGRGQSKFLVTRFNLRPIYLEADQLTLDAVALVARDGWRLLTDYRFDPATGLWRHRRGLVEPPLRLSQVNYEADGGMAYPHHDDRAAESDLAAYLAEAISLFAASAGEGTSESDRPSGALSADFEHLRWFDLPAQCLTVG